jgi:ATP-dependent DNA helicase DinG
VPRPARDVSRDTARALDRATSSLPMHEDRPQQKAMAEAVAKAIAARRHLIVQAGTGTGKSLAYLVPAVVLGQRVVVSTATKALQDQLALRDLPLLKRSLGLRFDFAVLKGRSNYICRQRVNEINVAGEQLALAAEAGAGAGVRNAGSVGRQVRKLVEWAEREGPRLAKGALSGDRALLSFEPSDAAWAQVSTGWRECPGARDCPSGERCFAELARERAAEADVVVVNTHLYATSLALPEAELLPPHDLVVFDEAHELEDIASGALGFELSPARVSALARVSGRLLGEGAGEGLETAASTLGGVLQAWRGQGIARPFPEDIAGAAAAVRERANGILEELRKAARAGGMAAAAEVAAGRGASGAAADAAAQLQRAQKSLGHLIEDANSFLELPKGYVAWVEGGEPLRAGPLGNGPVASSALASGALASEPVVRVAPIDVGAVLAERLWRRDGAPTAVLTSATIPLHFGTRLGLGPGDFDELDVGSPFSYGAQALLYCPVHLPDPRSPSFEPSMHEELLALIDAAEGRTLALFTSWRAMQAAVEVVRRRASWPVLAQPDLPKAKLIAAFASEEHSCLFATMGFWQGVDVPGPSLSLVTIDRLPFPRPDDPLVAARREALGPRAFEMVDLPRAATLLAQGVGRLVRSREDRGVVAVFDRRLGKASYRWELVNALPPMKRTRSRAEVVAFLASLRSYS